MKSALKRIGRHVFTGPDNQTYSIAKFSWAGSMLAICAVMIHRAWAGQEVDLMGAAGALATVATSHSAAIWGTKSTEPPPK